MNHETNKAAQASMLRLLVGGYLVYLAWDLRTSVQESLLFLAAVAVFGLVGAALVIHSAAALLKNSGFRKDAPAGEETDKEETG